MILGLLLALLPSASAQPELRLLQVQSCPDTASPSQALGAVLRTTSGSAVLISPDGVVLSKDRRAHV